MLSSVTLTVPARVHLGFFDLSATSGRRFGSLGLALERPVTSVTVRRAAQDVVEGPDQERAARHLATLKHALSISGGYAVRVDQAIPAHAGLGSGTQLALAIAGALRTLNGLPLAPRSDAALLGRGARSGVGIGLFESGGLVVDGGRGGLDAPPPILARLAFPPEWRVLLVFDERCHGVHGAEEVQAFRNLPDFPAASAARICHLVLMQALPSVAEADLARFGAAIAEIQQLLGEYFAPAQGGVFTSAAVQTAVRFLASKGGHGPGQSSWGPTGFVFVRNAHSADELAAAFARERQFDGLRLDVVAARNHGAVIDRGEQLVSAQRAPSHQQQRHHHR